MRYRTREVMVKAINQHLESLGFSKAVSAKCAFDGYMHFEKKVCNSRDPYLEACNFAGEKAHVMQPSVKYKAPKKKSKPRAKKPQDAFDFGGM